MVIGIMSRDEIEAMLHRHRVGRLACSLHDQPYIVPITYVFADQYLLSSSALGRKIEMMREQPIVCFEVDEIDSDSSWRSVVVEGRFEEVNDAVQRRDVLLRLATGDDQVVPPTLDRVARLIVFRIRITSCSGRFEQRDA